MPITMNHRVHYNGHEGDAALMRLFHLIAESYPIPANLLQYIYHETDPRKCFETVGEHPAIPNGLKSKFVGPKVRGLYNVGTLTESEADLHAIWIFHDFEKLVLMIATATCVTANHQVSPRVRGQVLSAPAKSAGPAVRNSRAVASSSKTSQSTTKQDTPGVIPTSSTKTYLPQEVGDRDPMTSPPKSEKGKSQNKAFKEDQADSVNEAHYDVKANGENDLGGIDKTDADKDLEVPERNSAQELAESSISFTWPKCWKMETKKVMQASMEGTSRRLHHTDG